MNDPTNNYSWYGINEFGILIDNIKHIDCLEFKLEIGGNEIVKFNNILVMQYIDSYITYDNELDIWKIPLSKSICSRNKYIPSIGISYHEIILYVTILDPSKINFDTHNIRTYVDYTIFLQPNVGTNVCNNKTIDIRGEPLVAKEMVVDRCIIQNHTHRFFDHKINNLWETVDLYFNFPTLGLYLYFDNYIDNSQELQLDLHLYPSYCIKHNLDMSKIKKINKLVDNTGVLEYVDIRNKLISDTLVHVANLPLSIVDYIVMDYIKVTCNSQVNQIPHTHHNNRITIITST